MPWTTPPTTASGTTYGRSMRGCISRMSGCGLLGAAASGPAPRGGAHLIVNRAPAEYENEIARDAAEIAMRAAPCDDVPRLDFSRVLAAAGHHGLADEHLTEHVYDRDDGDGPAEPPVRSRRATG